MVEHAIDRARGAHRHGCRRRRGVARDDWKRRLGTHAALPCCLAPRVRRLPASRPGAGGSDHRSLHLRGRRRGSLPRRVGGSDNPGIQVHGYHFIPSAVGGNATIISFLANSIGSNVANLPLSASSGGETFRFEGATPVRTSISPGPIYAERAQTLGSGRLFLSLSRTGLHYETLRGVPLDAVPLVFTHSNVDFPNCDAIFGGDCTVYGIPDFENEVIDFTLGLDVNVDVTAFALTYGVHDRIDLGVVLPVVKTSLRGTSTATIIPFGTAGPPPHFFAGTEDDPVLTASRFVEGSSSGLGDVSARVKVNLREATPVSLAILAEGRFPTGSEEDLRGSGAVALRGLGIVSARLGDFSPHANIGYQYRGRELDPDVFLLTAGFDQLLSPWATLAADLISEFPIGNSEIPFRATWCWRNPSGEPYAPPPSPTAGTTSSTHRSGSSSPFPAPSPSWPTARSR